MLKASAAAPDLLEALQMCESWFERHSPTAPCIDGVDRVHPMLSAICAAIDKARGGRMSTTLAQEAAA